MAPDQDLPCLHRPVCANIQRYYSNTRLCVWLKSENHLYGTAFSWSQQILYGTANNLHYKTSLRLHRMWHLIRVYTVLKDTQGYYGNIHVPGYVLDDVSIPFNWCQQILYNTTQTIHHSKTSFCRMWHLIRVYIVCLGLSVPILRVIMVILG